MIVLLYGCYAEATFEDDLDEAICAWKETCWQEPAAACAADAAAAREEHADCVYRAGPAQECVSGVRQLACPDTGGDFGFPSACDEVWDCE